jgi:hypothetical protein
MLVPSPQLVVRWHYQLGAACMLHFGRGHTQSIDPLNNNRLTNSSVPTDEREANHSCT